jgi:cytochrome bd-type quinol oxidase subunit 2
MTAVTTVPAVLAWVLGLGAVAGAITHGFVTAAPTEEQRKDRRRITLPLAGCFYLLTAVSMAVWMWVDTKPHGAVALLRTFYLPVVALLVGLILCITAFLGDEHTGVAAGAIVQDVLVAGLALWYIVSQHHAASVPPVNKVFRSPFDRHMIGGGF